jgi:hypothetical protein
LPGQLAETRTSFLPNHVLDQEDFELVRILSLALCCVTAHFRPNLKIWRPGTELNRLRQLYCAASIAVNNWFSYNNRFTSDAGTWQSPANL